MRPSRSQSSGARGRRFSDGGGGGGGSVGAGRRASSSTPGSKRGATSRDSSTGSREVRCGCQYYQSDNPLPERISLVGTRPSSRAMGDHEYEPISPPGARAVVPALSVTDIEGVTMQEPPAGPDAEPIMSDDSSGSPTRAGPVDVNVRVPYDGEEEVRTMGDDSDHDLDPDLGRDENLGPDGDLEEDDMLTAQQYQDEMEAQFFNLPTGVSIPPSTPAGGYPVESQTSAESQVDSSQPSQGSSGLPQRLRTQAGRIKTKLRSINRPKLPTIPRPKRPNISFPKFSRSAKTANTSSSDSTKGAQSKENQPPKERHLSSESTSGSTKHIFNFSTVPRVFSRRPKRPKSARSTSPATLEVESSLDSAPRRKSISQRFVEKVRDIHFVDDNPEEKRRREQERDQKREKEMHDRYLKQRERRESKEKERELKELERIRKENEKFAKRMSIDITQTPVPFKGKRTTDEGLVFHVSLHGSDSEPDYVEDPFNGPPYPEISEDDLGLALLTKPKSEGPSRSQSAMDMDTSLQEYSRDQSVDPTGQETPASPGDSDRENRSSGTSSERHRRGVLEEIDSDEFFLRQKGISQEDVEMGRFISSEIRDALRAPEGRPTRDWSRIEYADDEDDEEEDLEGRYPTKPERSALQTTQASTLPPSRPSRTRTLRPWRQGRKIPPTPPGDEPEEEEEEEDDEEEVQESPVDPSSYYNTFPPSRPTRTGKAKKRADEEPHPEDELALEQEFEDIGPEHEAPEVQRRLNESVAIFSEDFGILAPSTPAKKEPPPRPQPPKRLRKSMTSLERERSDDTLAREAWRAKMAPEDNEALALAVEVDYIIPPAPEPPVPPARRRPRSRATSQADEDRTSRGAESLPSERDIDIVDIDVVGIDGHVIDDEAENISRVADSYALVSKQQTQQRPRRSRSSKTLSAPGRRKRNQTSRLQNWRQFFSLPRRSSKASSAKGSAAEPPVRPMRNYSTLGPARPPRRNSRQSRELLYVEDEILHKTETPLESEADAECAKDLQSSEITLKMKDRPLPAPPRPPRRPHEGTGHDEEDEECRQVILPDHVSDEVPPRRPSREERIEALAVLRDDFLSRSRETPPPEPPPVPRSPTGEELEPVFEPPYKTFRKKKKVPPVPTEVESKVETVHLQGTAPPDEVSIAIQTDPLPDDFCVEESIHQDDQSMSQFEPTTETGTTETWPTVVEVERTIAEDIPSLTASSTTESKPEASTAPPPIPPRLQISSLDVSRLNVSELQAHRLTVSEIDSATISTSELSAQAGSLSLASGELPHTLAQAVADAVHSALSGVNEALSRPLEIVQQQHELQQQMKELQELQQLHQQQSEQSQQLVLQQLQAQLQQFAEADHLPPPVPPPPPSYSIHTQTSLAEAPVPPPATPSYSIQTQTSLKEAPSPPQPPSSSIQTQTSLAESPAPPVPPSLTESEFQSLSVSSPPPPPPRRIRTPVPAESDDSEEMLSRSPPSSRRRRTQSSHSSSQPTDELDVTSAGRQLAVACRASLARALNTLYSSLEPALTAALSDSEANAKRRELQAALCLMLIVAAAMVIISCGCMGSKVQHHHWDFHLPPPL